MVFTSAAAKAGRDCQIDSTVRFGANVEIGDAVVIEPYVVIHDDVRIGDGCFIGAHAVLGAHPSGYSALGTGSGSAGLCQIGPQTRIGPAAVIENNVLIGEDGDISGNAVIRAGARIGRRFRMGAFSEVRGGAHIEDYVTLLSQVHVCRGAILKSFCWIMPYVVLLNDRFPPTRLDVQGPTVGEYSVIGCHSILFPGVQLGKHVIVGANCVVRQDMPDYHVVSGFDSRITSDCRFIPCKLGKEFVRPYPWPRHVPEGFPWQDNPNSWAG